MVGLEHLLWNIRKQINYLFRLGAFDFDGKDIISHQGLRKTQRISADHITKWQVFPEMIVDVVEIVLRDGTIVYWQDTYNDLLSILRSVAKEKQVNWTRKPE
jgi:hypothetical protein